MADELAAADEATPAETAATTTAPDETTQVADTPDEVPLILGKYKSTEAAIAALPEAERRMHQATEEAAHWRRIAEETAAVRPTQSTTPTEPDPTQDEDFVSDYWEKVNALKERHADRLAIAGLKGEEPPELDEEQLHQQAVAYAKPRFDRRLKKAQSDEQRFQQAIEERVAPLRYADNFRQAKEQAGVSDVTQDDLDAVADMIAADRGQDARQVRAGLQAQDARSLKFMVLAARGLRETRSPSTRTRATSAPPAAIVPATGPRNEGGAKPVPDAAIESARVIVRKHYGHLIRTPEQLDDLVKEYLAKE